MAEGGLPIRDKRARKAERVIARYGNQLGQDMMLTIAAEIGLDNCLIVEADEDDPEQSSLSMDLTDLQAAAFAMAIACVAEMRGLIEA